MYESDKTNLQHTHCQKTLQQLRIYISLGYKYFCTEVKYLCIKTHVTMYVIISFLF